MNIPDAVILSDIHLGSDNCQAKALVEFLESINDRRLRTKRLILNGDVFDSIDFRRLKKNHWKVLSEIRKLSDEIEVVWVAGNHDGSAEIVSHLVGVTVVDEIVVESDGQKVLFLHGQRRTGILAIVTPQTMPYVLLGNSYLTRFQMRRENDQMTLERRY